MQATPLALASRQFVMPKAPPAGTLCLDADHVFFQPPWRRYRCERCARGSLASIGFDADSLAFELDDSQESEPVTPPPLHDSHCSAVFGPSLPPMPWVRASGVVWRCSSVGREGRERKPARQAKGVQKLFQIDARR